MAGRLIFDGDCGFCTTSARWIEARLPADTEVVAWQFIDDLAALGLTVEAVTEKVWWVGANGRPRGGHLAIGDALIAAGGIWGLIGRVMIVPPLSWLAAPVYKLVARHRHRLPGGTPACRLEPPADPPPGAR